MKVGDKVRRLKKYQGLWSTNWTERCKEVGIEEDAPVIISKIISEENIEVKTTFDQIIGTRGEGWYKDRFELVSTEGSYEAY